MGSEENKELRLLDRDRNGRKNVILSKTGVVILLIVVTVLLYAWFLFLNLKWMPLFVTFAITLHLIVILHM